MCTKSHQTIHRLALVFAGIAGGHINETSMKTITNTALVLGAILSLAGACRGAVSTNDMDPDRLEYELDRAQAAQNANALIQIYTNIQAQVSSSQLVRVEYDGANALFATYAGLAWAYLHADRELPRGLDFALRARKLGYETGVPTTNPERFANHLHILSLYYEKPELADREQAMFYHNEAWETWPYFNGDMLNLWRRKRAAVYYDPEKAIPITLELVNNAPFVNTLFYRNCGWHYMLLEDYRNAFSIWFRGLIDGEPHFWNSPTPERVIQYIEHATLDELRETKRLFMVNAAKYPATIKSTGDIVAWMRWADNPHLNFEIRLREAEQAGDAQTVTNLWKQGLSLYRRPLYAEKLGDYDALVRIYCDRMKEQLWWWLFPDYSLMPKVDRVLQQVNPDTLRYYRDTLARLAATHKSRTQAVERLTTSVAELEARYPSLTSPADSP